MQQPPADQGFTLLEAVVALVIFATVTVALQQAHITGLRGIRSAHSEISALEIARSLLAGAGPVQSLRPDLDVWGDDGLYRWHLVARKYAAPEHAPSLPPQLEGFWTVVTVSWRPANQSGRSVALETLKLQAAAP